MATDLRTKLILEAEATGADKLEQAADFLRVIAESAGDAAPQMKALADEFDKLAGDQRLVTSLRETADATNAVGEAAERQEGAFDGIGAAMQRAGIQADSLEQAQEQINQRMVDAGEKLIKVADEYGKVGDEAKKAGTEARTAFDGADEGVDALQKKLATVTKAVAGLFAASKIKQFAGDAVATADAFGQMAARVRLATDSEEEFERVQARLLETSNIVARNLAEQQELYVNAAQVLKDYGKNAEQVLNVTDGFTFLLDRNAASADKAQSAINAYSRALQTGNINALTWQTILSAMPSVVDDLSETLGIAGEEVRKMAMAGQLAVEDLTQAFEDSVERNKAAAEAMPETVAGAMNRLRNTWGEFLRIANESSGATEKMVAAIRVLSDNLERIVPVAMQTGKVIAALFALRAIRAVQGYAAAIIASARAMDSLNASARAATGSVTAAGAALQRVGKLAAGLAFAELASQVLSITNNLLALRDVTRQYAETQVRVVEIQAAVAEKLSSISESTGVAVSSMEELTAAQRDGLIVFDEANARWLSASQALEQLGQITSQTADQVDKLTTRAVEVINKFHELNDAGATTAEALSKTFKELDLGDPSDIEAYTRALTTMQSVGTLSANEVRDAWRDAVATMTGEQLQTAQKSVQRLFDDLRIGANEFASMMRDVLGGAFDTLGVEASRALGEVGESVEEALDAIDALHDGMEALGVSAARTTDALEAALVAAIPSAQSLEAVGALADKVQELADSGDLSAEAVRRLNEALDDQQKVIEDATPGIQSLEEALRKLGITSQTELERAARNTQDAFNVVRESGQATTAEINQAWAKMAEASIAANKGVADATIKAQAAAHGYEVAIDEAGQATVVSMDKAADAVQKTRKHLEEMRDAAAAAKDEARGLGAASREAAEDAEQTHAVAADHISSSYGQMGEKIQGTWVSAEVASSRYAEAAKRHAWEIFQEQSEMSLRLQKALGEQNRTAFEGNQRIIANLTANAEDYVRIMRNLDDQAAAIMDGQRGAARGVEQLRMRLLELNGTEEEVAKARQERDQADIDRQIALMRIELERAQVDKDLETIGRLQQEIKLLQEQKKLIDEIAKAEQRRKQDTDRRRDRGRDNDARESRAREAPSGDVNITLNANGITDPVQLARKLEPELRRLGRLAK